MLFCVKHSLSPSIKAGGYGTAGWAIGGDIIVDLNKLVEIDIEIPKADGSFTSLRDVAPANRKGKQMSQSSAVKRRREDDANFREYDISSKAITSFLRGPPLSSNESVSVAINPTPSIRRRFDSTGPLNSSSGNIQERSQGGASSSFVTLEPSQLGNTPGQTSRTSTPTSTEFDSDSINTPSNANPFGYLDNPSNFPPAPALHTLMPRYAQSSAWISNQNMTTFGQLTMPMPVHVEPIHPYAYVTFGAGMRQKEVDNFTAKHKLEARYLAGTGDGIPYHVPLWVKHFSSRNTVSIVHYSAAHPVGLSNMLSGGFGFLSRLHGLSIDNLVEVEMVLADGRVVVVSENEFPGQFFIRQIFSL